MSQDWCRISPSYMVFGIGRPKISVGSMGSALVSGKIVMCLVRLYGSPTVVVWSKGMYGSRAKITGSAGESSWGTLRWVYCSREIAVGSAGILSSRAKVTIGCVMLVGSRKIAYRYVMIGIGCSVDHCGLFPKEKIKLNIIKRG